MPRTKPASAPVRVDLGRARAHWCASQGLAAAGGCDPVDIVRRTGWLRTLGGMDVYLAVRARCPTLRRADLDAAVARGALRVVPAARGCIYLVPAAHVPLAMSLAAALSRPRTERELARAGARWQEVEALFDPVLQALERGPLATAALRQALPAGALRSLGAAGKKVGMSSLLPVALRELEFRGQIERALEGGRLDTEKYLWHRAAGSPAAIHDDPDARADAITTLFLEVAGPATVKDIATWSGLPQKDIKAALTRIAAVPVVVDDAGAERAASFVLARDVDALRGAEPPPHVSLLPFEDNMITLHGGPGVLVPPALASHPVPRWGNSKATTLGEAKHISRRSILSGAELIGFWEYDPDTDEIVCSPFLPLSRQQQQALRAQREAVAAFVRDDVGHARSFSLDTDSAVRERVRDMRATASA